MRFKPGILETMQEEMKLALPHETGGVMVGSANFKTKTIHVVELIKAPPDSKANPVCFFRGVDGLPESIEKVNELTGNQLGYIGEWHTHPEGPEEMSTTDLRTVIKFKKEFDNLTAPLPVFLMIITPDNILPFVF
jgi:integrative and conjugative element protein (TIGR02256 family)